MRDALRVVAVLCVLGPLAAMAFEPFFTELLKLLGWDSAKWAAPMLTVVAGIVASGWFKTLAPLSIGFGCGALLDWFLRRFEKATAVAPAAPSSDLA